MNKTAISRKSSRRRLLRRQRLALALAVVLASPAAFAGVVPACGGCLPESGNVVSGAATSNLDVGVTMNPGPTTDNVMTITQTTPSAIIEWGTFSIDAGFTLNFIQPDANSVTLNRVIGFGYGPTPSYIQGSITATGNIFIVNPTGILFGKSSSVNVGGLVASTLDLSNADFAAGFAMADPHYIFTPTIRAGAPIVNQGQLTAAAGGTIALLASRIENQAGATISTPGGSTVFGAARGVNLDFYNDGLTTVTLTGPGYASPYGCAAGMSTSSCLGGIESTGTITAVGGHVEMRTTTDDGLAQPTGTPYFTEASNGGRIWIGGSVTAQSSATRAGSIVLDAGMGNIDIGGVSGQTGLVSAYATGSGLNAGTVDIKAYQLFTYVCVGPGGVCATNDSLGWIDATAYGAGGNGGAITINLTGDLYHAGVLQAGAAKGNGGLIDITAAGSAYIHNWITAEGLLGNGGTINIDSPSIYLYKGQRPWVVGTGTLYSQAVLSAYGSVDGGTVGLDFSAGLYVSDLGDVTPSDPEYAWMINVRGMNGNGGSVTGTGYLIDIGNTWFANANGYRDGGSITLSAGTSVNIAGRLEAMGGRTTDPNVSFGDGGTITISGSSVDLYGQFYADGGSRQSPYPGPSSYGGSVIVSGDYVTLHDGSYFEAVGASGSGWVDTRADYFLLVQGDVSVAAGGWYLGGSEGWIIPNSSLGSYSNGVVVVDQALSTATALGTSVSVNVDPGKHTGYGSGQIHFVTGASITGYGAWGGLDFTATQGIYGNGFTIDANLGRVAMDGGAGAVNLGNFTLDTHGGGGVYVDGSYVLLDNGSVYGWTAQLTATDPTGSGITLDDTSVHASTGNITLDASPSYGGIRIQNGASVISDSGSVKLDADGSSYGIIVDGSTIHAGGSYLTLESDAGIDIYNASSIMSYGGAISLDADASLAGIDIDGSMIYSHGGYIAMHGSNTDGGGIRITNGSIVDSGVGGMLLDTANGASGISVNASSLHASSGDIHLNSAGGSAGIYLSNAASITSDGGSVTLDASYGYGAGIDIDASTVHAGSGGLTLNAESSGGVQIDNSSRIETAGGLIQMFAGDSANGIVIDDSVVYSYGGDITMSSSGYNTGGIWLQNGAAIDSGNGAVRLDVVGGTVGIRVNDASSIHADGGDITLDATYNDGGIQVNYGSTVYSKDGAVNLLAPYSGSGIVIFGSMIHAGSAGITLDATYSPNGIRVTDGSTLETSGGDIALLADGSGYGIYVDASYIQSSGGDITMHSASGVGGGIVVQNAAMIDSGGGAILMGVAGGEFGIKVDGSTITSATGGITLDATGNRSGIQIQYDASIISTSGDITLTALGSDGGISVYESQISSGTGGINLEADSAYLYGVLVTDSDILSAGGDISISGTSTQALGRGVLIHDNSTISSGGGVIDLTGTNANGAGLWIDGSSVASAGGSIAMQGTGGSVGGVDLYYSSVDSGGGDIRIDGTVTGNATGVALAGSTLDSGVGDITIDGSTDGFGWGVFVYGTSLASTDGDIAITGHADTGYGIELRHDDTYAARITSDSGNINLVGDGSLAGVLVNSSSDIASTSGDIEIDGRGTTGAGVNLRNTASVNAGSGTVVLRAANDGNSDSIIIDGAVSSTTGVNLRPLDVTDILYLGGGNGFVLDNVELSHITTPWLVLGSNLQQGEIRVQSDIAYAGNLSLQNQGGTAGIQLSGMLDVSGYTLGLFAGGFIAQSGAGSIHAKSLIAIAGGDVLLASAQNDVTGNTLAGSAGGQFRYLDANELAIGNVTGYGFNAGVGGGLTSVGVSGINANGNVLVRTLSGNLTMNANVNGVDVDLVTAGVFLNPAGATINASGDWRIWASTWLGEDRGGLAGNGSLPNLYNCTYGGPCGVTVGSGNHFIYTQQPTLTILIDDASREYGDANPSFNYSASGLILGDDLAYVLSGYLSSLATSGSNVGQYAITGNFTSAAGYAIAFTPGSLTITPATLLFTADPLLWYMGVPFPAFTGTISGFKNGDTAASVFGNNPYWFTNASPLSMPGFYAIYGGGNAQNYVFAQATGNQSALHLIPAAITSDQPTTFVSERNDTDVYDTNIGQVEMCPVSDSGNDQALEGGDALGGDWSKVRKRLNLLNCFSNDKKGGCSGSF
ncbi:MAG: filamentous hemagglutinin N-terminal domain-containing protein [Proteobacteria bacterium]|nr:filamentous hemagglutinin N-terminal domain-containing protein [Pseudomonadota bacterium]